MSSHYLYLTCEKCSKVESIYTGEVYSNNFDDEDWEGEFLEIKMCKECKEADERYSRT